MFKISHLWQRKIPVVQRHVGPAPQECQGNQHVDNMEIVKLLDRLIDESVHANEALGISEHKKACREYITIALLAATTLFTGLTYWVFYDQLTEMKIASNISKQTLFGTQRAFVFPENFDTLVIKDSLQVSPKWQNSGSTPANPVKLWASWKVFRDTPPIDFNFPDLGANGENLPSKMGGAPFFMGPKDSKSISNIKIPLSVVESVRMGQGRLFLWGWAEYKDAFEGTPIHRTEFCYEMVVTDMGKEGEKTSVSVAFDLYGPYNTAN